MGVHVMGRAWPSVLSHAFSWRRLIIRKVMGGLELWFLGRCKPEFTGQGTLWGCNICFRRPLSAFVCVFNIKLHACPVYVVGLSHIACSVG